MKSGAYIVFLKEDVRSGQSQAQEKLNPLLPVQLSRVRLLAYPFVEMYLFYFYFTELRKTFAGLE